MKLATVSIDPQTIFSLNLNFIEQCMELPTNQLHDKHIKPCILAVLVGRNKAGAAQLVRNFDWLSVLLGGVGVLWTSSGEEDRRIFFGFQLVFLRLFG